MQQRDKLGLAETTQVFWIRRTSRYELGYCSQTAWSKHRVVLFPASHLPWSRSEYDISFTAALSPHSLVQLEMR